METTETINRISTLWDKGKLFLKSVIIFFMALALWLPTHLILDIVKERESRQNEAIADISSKWAGKQIITGPMLMIPYNEILPGKDGSSLVVKKQVYFMADKSDIRSTVYPEKRHRGIYEVAVYKSDITMNVKFRPLQWEQLKIPAENILWGEAAIVFRILDNLKGINEDLFAKWDDSTVQFNPQSPGQTHLSDAFVAGVPLKLEDASKEHSCSMQFSLNGSEQLLFTASARENKLQMQSAWPDPSFTGIKLPDTREITDSGFFANWKFMNRAVAPVWNDVYYDQSSTVLGADLLIPVDTYDKTERSIKYALLCIILTFASFFLIETIYKRPLHLVHYGLAGLALVLFYSLLLSVSEYTGFNLAYLLAGLATIGLVAWFVGSVMRSGKLAMFISFVLTVVYSYIFSIIQIQDYALLMGSIGLFIALGIIMYFSRKLQW